MMMLLIYVVSALLGFLTGLVYWRDEIRTSRREKEAEA
jgi:hypothetical protein